MIETLIYGKIIIDTVKLADGQIHDGLLGGGGPQATFGACLWHASVGLLTRSGADIEPHFPAILEGFGADLSGWAKYPDLSTVYGGLVAYDEDEFDVEAQNRGRQAFRSDNWFAMLGRPLQLPPHYQQPKAIHLVTEFFSEPMVETALKLRESGTLLSLEPLLDFRKWHNRDQCLELLPQVDIVTPDWPAASGIANNDDPKIVLAHWATLGASVVAIRHGRNGSYVWDRFTNQSWHIPIVPVTAIDPTGAGNSYGAGLCVGWLGTNEAAIAGCYGTVAASFVVEAAGMPTAITAEMKSVATKRLKALKHRIKRL